MKIRNKYIVSFLWNTLHGHCVTVYAFRHAGRCTSFWVQMHYVSQCSVHGAVLSFLLRTLILWMKYIGVIIRFGGSCMSESLWNEQCSQFSNNCYDNWYVFIIEMKWRCSWNILYASWSTVWRDMCPLMLYVVICGTPFLIAKWLKSPLQVLMVTGPILSRAIPQTNEVVPENFLSLRSKTRQSWTFLPYYCGDGFHQE